MKSKFITLLGILVLLVSFSADASVDINRELAKITPDSTEKVVGIWSYDIEESNQSIVIEFWSDGNFDMMIYDRFNIKKYDVAVGKYVVQDNKIYTVLYGAHGSNPYFKLNEIKEIDVIKSDDNNLVLKSEKEVRAYSIISRRYFTKSDSI